MRKNDNLLWVPPNAKIFHFWLEQFSGEANSDLIPENCATQNESFVEEFEGGERSG